MLNLELKSIQDPALLIEYITTYLYEFEGEIVISSFDHHLLQAVKMSLRNTRIEKHIKIGALIAHAPIDYAQYAIDLQADIAAIDADLVSAGFVEHAHQYNLDVWSYTVNEKKDLERLTKMGVDAVFTNDPLLMHECLLGK